ncbi:NAD(P)-dependent alcohol dehydrogenase [Maribacter confluentis]|uniref:NAD(P)-dependent alcohol dehydrogenase n=1 Tax=Maribacter confluentis TaxID=1656093 RepID=A0ABT8RST1_9FLAO|nr:NAD(P)-dependent alcohol dehydrogenase [Maribacter confluentis]MDO1513567.1 NAD(P)-dependent alcohol dehydrogenase [Maribacter confluentis]
MKAYVKLKYGGPEILELKDISTPEPNATELLVNIKANSLNPADWHILRGKPYLTRLAFGLIKPKNKVLGADFAGEVTKIGSQVTTFQVGDMVFGERTLGGAFAEYVTIPENKCAPFHNTMNVLKMACLPMAGTTALQALFTHGNLKKSETVLINGASGGVGHFAVQVAKAYGAKVTAICSDKNKTFVKKLGADDVIAYDKENIQFHNKVYDLVIDAHGNFRHTDYKRLGKRGVIVGFTTMNKMISLLLRKAFSKYPLAQFTAMPNKKDLETLAQLLADKKIDVHIAQEFSYLEIPKAIHILEKKRTRGKLAITWEH